jgi:hypothetical protein
VNSKQKRASRIRRHAIPLWLRTKLGEAYQREIFPWLNSLMPGKPKIPSRDVAMLFLLNRNPVAPSCLIGFVDHYGTDPEGNFICEPYAATCKGCQKDAAEFARRIGAKLTVSKLTFHAPDSPRCVRFTFSPEESKP